MMLVWGQVVIWTKRVLLLRQHALRREKQGGWARKQDASMIVARTLVAGRRKADVAIAAAVAVVVIPDQRCVGMLVRWVLLATWQIPCAVAQVLFAGLQCHWCCLQVVGSPLRDESTPVPLVCLTIVEQQ